MAEELWASVQQTPPETPEFDLDAVLKHPKMQAYLQERDLAAEARIEAYWKPRYDSATQEMGKKENGWGTQRRLLEEKLEEAEAKVATAKLGDDAEALARSRAQVARLQRELGERDQVLTQRERELEVRSVAAGIFASHPTLTKQFQDDAVRRLRDGTPSYVIEREALALDGGTKPPPQKPGVTVTTTGSPLAGVAQGGTEAERAFFSRPVPNDPKELAAYQKDLYQRLGVTGRK